MNRFKLYFLLGAIFGLFIAKRTLATITKVEEKLHVSETPESWNPHWIPMSDYAADKPELSARLEALGYNQFVH